jgi:hypothetical protein
MSDPQRGTVVAGTLLVAGVLLLVMLGVLALVAFTQPIP